MTGFFALLTTLLPLWTLLTDLLAALFGWGV